MFLITFFGDFFWWSLNCLKIPWLLQPISASLKKGHSCSLQFMWPTCDHGKIHEHFTFHRFLKWMTDRLLDIHRCFWLSTDFICLPLLSYILLYERGWNRLHTVAFDCGGPQATTSRNLSAENNFVTKTRHSNQSLSHFKQHVIPRLSDLRSCNTKTPTAEVASSKFFLLPGKILLLKIMACSRH